MSIRHDLVDLILMALDNNPPPPIERVSGLAGRRARVENGVEAILARFAVVELPEPHGTESDRFERASYWAGPEEPYGCSLVEADGVKPGIYIEFPEWVTDPAAVRDLAAALLAAANRAEAVQP